MGTTTAPTTTPANHKPAIDFFKIPDWLLEHPELRKRGIVLQRPIQPFTVYQTQRVREGPIYVVKAIDPSRPEVDIYDQLDQLSESPTNHTIPHEIIRCERPLVVMPFASRIEDIMTYKTSSILDAFDQVLEGVEHMHRLRIAHGDLFGPNIVAAKEQDAQRDTRLTAGRVYLIDFETSQQFEHGPGVQTAFPLPHTHVIPPREMKTFDPFSWDVYCLGETLQVLLMQKFLFEPESKPRIPRMFAQWLKGDEAGFIRWFVGVAELVTTVFTYPMTLFRTPQVDSYQD